MAPLILIVEDDESERILYEEIFKEEGYQVEIVPDGETAMKRIREQHYDLVVLDINMPGKDGVDVLRETMGVDHKLPVILNTAYPAYKDNYTTWSAAAYVVKTSDPTELVQTVRNVLAGGK